MKEKPRGHFTGSPLARRVDALRAAVGLFAAWQLESRDLRSSFFQSCFPVRPQSDGHCFFRLSLYTVFSKQASATIKTMRRREQ